MCSRALLHVTGCQNTEAQAHDLLSYYVEERGGNFLDGKACQQALFSTKSDRRVYPCFPGWLTASCLLTIPLPCPVCQSRRCIRPLQAIRTGHQERPRKLLGLFSMCSLVRVLHCVVTWPKCFGLYLTTPLPRRWFAADPSRRSQVVLATKVVSVNIPANRQRRLLLESAACTVRSPFHRLPLPSPRAITPDSNKQYISTYITPKARHRSWATARSPTRLETAR